MDTFEKAMQVLVDSGRVTVRNGVYKLVRN